MPNIVESIARETVVAFRAELDQSLVEQLGDTQLDRLELLVREAVAAGLQHAAERVDGVVKELRGESESGTLPLEL